MKKLFLIVTLLILSYVGFSQTIPENKGYVTDYENLFTPEQNAQLTKILTDYENETSIEIAVLTVKDFESDIADFAQKTATKWGLGKKDINNGLLIVISRNRKVFRSETGYGLEGYLPDGWLKLQGDSIVQTYFKNTVVVSSKGDTSVMNKANEVLNTSQNWLNQNITDPDLRKVLSDVNVLKVDTSGNNITEKSTSDTNARYFEGTKAFILACITRIGKEGYSEDHNKELIEKNKKEESIIAYLLRVVPWWGWVLIVVIWFIIFLIDPGLAIQLLFLGFAGKGGGGGGFGGGKFGGGGSSSKW